MLAAAMKRSLVRRGIGFVGVDRGECDILDDASVQKAFEEHQPKLVINCAAYTAVDKAEEEPGVANALNGEAVGRLAAACKVHGAKLVHISTDFVFSGESDEPYDEEDEPGPVSAYGQSKLAGERALRASGVEDWLILRTAWLYGPWAGRPFPKIMLDAAKAGKPLKVVGDQHGSPTLTIDLAEALLDLVEAKANGIFHVTGGGRTTWFEFTQEIMKAFGVEPTSLEPVTGADWAAMKPGSARRPAMSVLKLDKLEHQLGRSMRDWKAALRDYRDLVAGQP
jgi:dTDP-4-dehydrorhamnose reductase